MVTKLQGAVLATLALGEWRSGKEVRYELVTDFTLDVDGPGFYQLVDRMLQKNLIQSRHELVASYRETEYQITEEGRDELRKLLEFGDMVARYVNEYGEEAE